MVFIFYKYTIQICILTQERQDKSSDANLL